MCVAGQSSKPRFAEVVSSDSLVRDSVIGGEPFLCEHNRGDTRLNLFNIYASW